MQNDYQLSDPNSLPDFEVFVEDLEGGSDLCAEFKRGRIAISGTKLYLTCTQPERGKVVRTKGTWTQKTQIISTLTVYTLASDSRQVITEDGEDGFSIWINPAFKLII